MHDADFDLRDVDYYRPYISIGTGIDTTAVDDIAGWVGGMLEMSDPRQIVDATYTMSSNLATYEGDGIPTATHHEIIAPPISPMDAPPHTGIWSDVISDANGGMNWTFTVELSEAHTSALTLYGDPSGVVVEQARFSYYLGGMLVREITVDRVEKGIVDRETTTYDKIEITVLRISEPYKHARISEIEFGASVTVEPEDMGEEVVLIQDRDPWGISAPISELDFSLLNVDGRYDFDNPDSRIDELALGTPVWYSITVGVGSKRMTVPMGKYYIIEHNTVDDIIELTAMDARIILSEMTAPIELVSGEPIAQSIADVLSTLRIPHMVDPSATEVVADASYSPVEPMDVLTQLIYIAQRYDIMVSPRRDGVMYIHLPQSKGTAPVLDAEVLLKYPTPSFARTYNFISIQYGSEIYHRDVGQRGSEEAVMAITISNPLITTEAQAIALADKIEASVYSQEYLATAVGDPRIDIDDIVPIEGRWSAGSPTNYDVASLELTYDGGMTMRIKGIK